MWAHSNFFISNRACDVWRYAMLTSDWALKYCPWAHHIVQYLIGLSCFSEAIQEYANVASSSAIYTSGPQKTNIGIYGSLFFPFSEYSNLPFIKGKRLWEVHLELNYLLHILSFSNGKYITVENLVWWYNETENVSIITVTDFIDHISKLSNKNHMFKMIVYCFSL